MRKRKKHILWFLILVLSFILAYQEASYLWAAFAAFFAGGEFVLSVDPLLND